MWKWFATMNHLFFIYDEAILEIERNKWREIRVQEKVREQLEEMCIRPVGWWRYHLGWNLAWRWRPIGDGATKIWLKEYERYQ